MMGKDEMIFKDPYSEAVPSPVRDLKRTLLTQHRKEHPGILERLQDTGAGFATDQLLNLVMEDMLYASEELQGTSLYLEQSGDMPGSSAIIIKRADLLKLVAEIAAKRKELNQREGEVDLNSPVFQIFQKLCFDRMVESMEEMRVEPEMVNLILTKWRDKMAEWGKDLKKALKEREE